MEGSRVGSRVLKTRYDEGRRRGTLQGDILLCTGATQEVPRRNLLQADPTLGAEQNVKFPGHGAHVLEKEARKRKQEKSNI